jgi:hypothetical protein
MSSPRHNNASHGVCHFFGQEIIMTANVGKIDKVVRIIAGIVLLALFFILEGSARWLGLIGLVPLVTGLVGWCPAYSLIGLNTCPAK